MTKTIGNNFETKLGRLWVYFIIESCFIFSRHSSERIRPKRRNKYFRVKETFSSQIKTS